MKDHNWHSDTMASFKQKSDDALRYIILDCSQAIEAGKDFNPKCGQYADEIHYAAMELKIRRDKIALIKKAMGNRS